MMSKIGVLAVQGAFIEHEHMLRSLGADTVEIREAKDLAGIDGIVLPGGESTVQGKLLRSLGMFEKIRDLIRSGLPALGTCAGLILLSQGAVNDPSEYLGTLPVRVRRNAYGRQSGSFETRGRMVLAEDGDSEPEPAGEPFTMTFIRAPYIESVGDGVRVLARVDGKIVAAQYKNQIGLAFHPELGTDPRVHEMFLAQCG
ncbi:MAG: pyridoxal 5'-phosphate synthase glutaminase subunit PdxT [Eubacteriales bacterium]